MDFDKLSLLRPKLEEHYMYYQEMRAFLTDFIDCYNEKVKEQNLVLNIKTVYFRI
jgi:hypothetical protein